MFPVGDFLRTRTTPYVNYTLLAVNVAVFLYMLTLSSTAPLVAGVPGFSEVERFMFDWGYVPACVADYFGFSTSADPRALALVCPDGGREPLQVISAMFVHAGWAHIVGNMLFLWIFGDNVEDNLGHLRYLCFYLACGIVASAVQTFMAVDTVIPNVGASGAIAGVLGAYLLLYPTKMVQVIVFPLFFIPLFVPAVLLIFVWFVMQLFAGLAEIGNATAGSGVAWWAHIGGFIAGVVLLLPLRRRPRRPQRAYA
jgi:membrane associated rhomboid family serine protease